MKELIEKLINTCEFITIEYGNNKLTEEGKEIFTRLCISKGYIKPDFHFFGDDWMVDDKTALYRGTLVKRYIAWSNKQYGGSAASTFVSEASNLLKQYVAEKEIFTFRFTRNIDWENGEFGERSLVTGQAGSCLWTIPARAGALEMIRKNGLAVQFFNTETKQPKGRAWISYINSETIVVFNGYGLGSENNTRAIAQVLGWWLNLPVKKINLCNLGQDSDDGVLFINNGEGFVVGNYNYPNYDLNWPKIKKLYCVNCHRTIESDDENVIYDGYNQAYCKSCADKHLTLCDESLQFYHNSYIIEAPDGKHYHQDIFHNKWGYCSFSREYYTYDKLHPLGYGRYVLKEHKDSIFICGYCGDAKPLNERSQEQDIYCTRCYHRYFKDKRKSPQTIAEIKWTEVKLTPDFSCTRESSETEFEDMLYSPRLSNLFFDTAESDDDDA